MVLLLANLVSYSTKLKLISTFYGILPQLVLILATQLIVNPKPIY